MKYKKGRLGNKQKKRLDKNMGLLLSGVGDLVTKKTEKHKILNVFLASFLSSKIGFRNPKP